MSDFYLKNINTTIDSSNDDIKNKFNEIKKGNEIDKEKKLNNDITKIDPEEFKKYSEPFSPYLFLLFAYKNGASDFQYIAMPEGDSLVRFKIDGIWSTEFSFHRDTHILYVNSLKNWLVKGSGTVKVENQKIPQDGKGIFYILTKDKLLEKSIQLRFASAPQHYTDSNGNQLEAVVVRLLGGSKEIPLEKSGFTIFDIEKLRSLEKIKKGLVLISGPTGSGKSTTLFNYIKKINDGTRNIITFENPVEIDVPGVIQLDINPIEDINDGDEITLNFDRGKKFAMRAAPDVALVGEIRDYMTALTAFQLSTTGHITLGTLHTQSVINTITRFLGLDKKDSIKRIDFISALKYVSAQMLSPRLCNHCKIKVKDIKTETGNTLKDDLYKEMLEDIEIQKREIKLEMGKKNIRNIIFKNISDENFDSFIEKLINESFVTNLDGCEHCKKSNKDFIHPRAGVKGIVMLNEALVFDEYVKKLLLSEDTIDETKIIENLTNFRPGLPKTDKYYIKDKKQVFFTLYQDALLKALLPKNVLKSIMNTDEAGILSVIQAKTYGKPEL